MLLILGGTSPPVRRSTELQPVKTVAAGRLPSTQVADGINNASRNALRLVEDVEMRLASQCFPTARSLTALSIEEADKVSIFSAAPTAAARLRGARQAAGATRAGRTSTCITPLDRHRELRRQGNDGGDGAAGRRPEPALAKRYCGGRGPVSGPLPQPRYCGLMPAICTVFCAAARSDFMREPSASGVPPNTSRPSCVKRSFAAGVAR